jgi:hypothetical protein
VPPLQLCGLTLILGHQRQRPSDLRVTHAKHRPPRENRTITVDFQNEATYFHLLGDGKAFVELVIAFVMSLGFQLKHKATCHGGGCLTRHSHYVRVRLGGVTIWRLQCTTCRAVFTVLPHFVLHYRQMRPEVARDALLATHGGLSLEWCAVICHISPMALYRLVCALGQQSVVTVLTRCGLPLPTYFLADEKHSHCLTEKVYLPTIVTGRVIWHLGYTEDASAVAFTQSYQAFQRAASQQEPSYRVRGILTDGFDSTTKSMRTLFPGARLGTCLRHALNKLPGKLTAIPSPVRKALRSQFHTLWYRVRQRQSLRVLRWASGYAALPIMSPPWLGQSMASGYAAGFRTKRQAGARCSPIRTCP